ncbi:hypothetical protein AB0L57_22725 [Nocardia sp. NPDC052254]|uniref:DUF6924 domain-containing protein n=1 Tax=Nocardia sp. NPDC052254 TaxID=3155681 RepID=UPI003429B488
MTQSLPEGDSLLIRTDFTDDAVWARTLEAVFDSYDDDTETGLTPVDDATFDGLAPGDLGDLIGGQTYLFLADTTTMTDPEHPLLVVDTSDGGGPAFRIAPSAMAEVEVNLFLANMDFEDYADCLGDDGVFHGFDH